MSRSRIEPLVMAPTQPSPQWMLVLTSPQKAPSPGLAVDILNHRDAGLIAVALDTRSSREVSPCARPVEGLGTADHHGSRKADDRRQLGEGSDQPLAREPVDEARAFGDLERIQIVGVSNWRR